jgi:hypothetical protein
MRDLGRLLHRFRFRRLDGRMADFADFHDEASRIKS